MKNKNKTLFTGLILILTIAIGILTYTSLFSRDNAFSADKVSFAEKSDDRSDVLGEVSQNFRVEGGMYYFDPNEIRVKAGETVTITFVNVEGVHDFIIDEMNVRTRQISAGETDSVEFTPENTGTYEFYCSVGNHRAMGMRGTLIVE